MKIMENMRIHTKLLLNSFIAIMSLIIIGLIGVFHSHHIAGVTMSLIETETIPIFKINALEQSTWQVMQRLSTYIQINDNNKQKQLIQEIEYEQEQIKKQIRMIEQLYQRIGDVEPHQEYWLDFKNYWQKLKQINQHIIEKSHQQALQLFLDKAQPLHQRTLAALHQLIDTHNQHLEAQSTAAKATKSWAIWIIALLTLLISSGMIYIMNRFSQRLLAPLNRVNEHLKTLAQGELNPAPLNYSGQDEISEIVVSVQKLKNSIQSTIEQTKAIAAGDYHHEVQLHSKQDQLGHALLDMMQALRQATAKNQIQDWLKSGQAQLNDAMSGEQDIITLGKNITTFLTTYLEAKVGLFYILHPTKPAYVELTASYAYTATESIPERFSLGEGLVGQAALEGRLLTRVQTPEESAHIIQSGLAKAVPSHVLLMPFLYENQVSGIIELGASQALTDIQQEFLLQVMPSIGIAVNTARSRTQMQELLEQSQLQAEKLTNQTEELKAQQLEMQQVNEELQVQQEEMKQVNEELQTQAEELQAQQEELRQTNEELEERTRELERQKQAIHDKNQALEKTQVEMEQAKEAIEIKAQELELASKYKSEFLANMSHELRTPLNSLLILAQLLAENKNGNLTEKQQEYAKTIHSAGSDLLTLINEILDLSKVEAGKMEVHLEDVVLSDLLKTIEPKFRHVAEEKGLQFEIHFGDQLPVELYTDAQRLKQIINNLLSNAFKFTEQGSVKLTIQRPAAEEQRAGLKPDKTDRKSVV